MGDTTCALTMHGWTKIPNALIWGMYRFDETVDGHKTARDISDSARMVYAILSDLARNPQRRNEVWQSRDMMLLAAGLRKSSYAMALNQLVAAGLILRASRRYDGRYTYLLGQVGEDHTQEAISLWRSMVGGGLDRSALGSGGTGWYTTVPQYLLYGQFPVNGRRLSPEARRLYMVLRSLDFRSTDTEEYVQQKLGALAGTADRTVRHNLTLLEQAGLIKRGERRGTRGIVIRWDFRPPTKDLVRAKLLRDMAFQEAGGLHHALPQDEPDFDVAFETYWAMEGYRWQHAQPS